MASEAAVQIKLLHKKRASFKSQMSMFETFLKKYEESPDVSALRTRLQKLETGHSTFEAIQAELEVLEEDEREIVPERCSIQERYLDLCTLADKHLGTYKHVESTPSTVSQSTSSTASAPHIQLPKADLPRFDGKYEDWTSFKDEFVSMVSSQETLSNVQKLYYLRQCLDGKAAKAIAKMETTDANYVQAWKMLEDTYANEKGIIARHGELLVRTPIVEVESADNLLAFAHHVQQHLRSLTSLKIPVAAWDVLLLALLRPKLPVKTWRKFDSTCGDKELPTIDGLMKFLAQRARTLEPSLNRTPHPCSIETRRKPQISRRTSDKPKSVFVTTSTTCVIFNDSTHSIYRCEQF